MSVFFAHTYLVENGTARHNSVCNTHDTFSRKKKEAAGPNRLGATLSLRTRVRDPASVRFAFFFFPFGFSLFFFLICFKCWCFLIRYERLATTPPSLCRDKFEVYCRPSLGARACAVCNVFFSCKKSPLRPILMRIGFRASDRGQVVKNKSRSCKSEQASCAKSDAEMVLGLFVCSRDSFSI